MRAKGERCPQCECEILVDLTAHAIAWKSRERLRRSLRHTQYAWAATLVALLIAIAWGWAK